MQSGIASNCNKYYKVQSGDTCNSVEKDKGISAADFNKWNPDVGSDCANLQLDFYVCVGLTGTVSSSSQNKPLVLMFDRIYYLHHHYTCHYRQNDNGTWIGAFSCAKWDCI